MRYTGHTIQNALREAHATHKTEPTTQTAVIVGKLCALRSLYETTVYARIALPGVGSAQRSLREAVECYRTLKGLVSAEELKQLKTAIHEARKVPCELPDIDFTA